MHLKSPLLSKFLFFLRILMNEMKLICWILFAPMKWPSALSMVFEVIWLRFTSHHISFFLKHQESDRLALDGSEKNCSLIPASGI